MMLPDAQAQRKTERVQHHQSDECCSSVTQQGGGSGKKQLPDWELERRQPSFKRWENREALEGGGEDFTNGNKLGAPSGGVRPCWYRAWREWEASHPPAKGLRG